MLADLVQALMLLTTLPVGWLNRFDPARKAGWSMASYPLVGVVIGVLLLLLDQALQWLNVALSLRAFALLVGWVLITGGLHLDGVADSADGLYATTTPARRLEIMRDPRTGSWAVIALVLVLLGKWIALTAWLQTISTNEAVFPVGLYGGLIVAPMLGRWVMLVLAWVFPSAREGGLSAHYREGLTWRQAAIAGIFTGVMGLLLHEAGLILALGVTGLALLYGRWASGRLGGGLTGDIYGSACEMTELLCLLIMVQMR